jgi:hypothetical protein
MTEAPRTLFLIEWPHDGARQIEAAIEADLPQYGAIEKRIRNIAQIATSHGALRMLLGSAFGDQWSIGVVDAVDGVTVVHMAPLDKISASQREREQRR